MNTTKEPMPSSRQLLFPGIAAHLETLATTLDTIAEPHHSAGRKLAAWIAASNGGRSIIVVCTGNSRRSLVGALMGQAAAAYYGLPQVRFFSGGTAPSAFNPRTIRALQAIGFEIEPVGEEAPRGEPSLPNPKYRIWWGVTGSGFESIEFSKVYSDRSNPQSGFAARWCVTRPTRPVRSSRVPSYGSRCRLPTRRPRTTRQTRSLATPRPAMRWDGS